MSEVTVDRCGAPDAWPDRRPGPDPPPRDCERRRRCFRVDGLNRKGAVRDIATLSLRAGEVVGLWGLLGSGRTELIRAIVGLDPTRQPVSRHLRRRRDAYGAGLCQRALRDRIGLVTEDRRAEGIIAAADPSKRMPAFPICGWPMSNRLRRDRAPGTGCAATGTSRPSNGWRSRPRDRNRRLAPCRAAISRR